MNLLFVSEYLLPPLGGGQFCLWSIAKELAKTHKVYAITNRTVDSEDHELVDNVEIFRFGPAQDLTNPRPFKLVLFSLGLYFQLFRFLKKNKIDVVHNNGGIVTLPTTYAASHYRIPVVSSIFFSSGAAKRKIYNPLLSFALDMYSKTVIRLGKHDVIQFDANYTRVQTSRYVKTKTVVIPTSFVDKAEIEEVKRATSTEAVRAELGLEADELFILFVGRLSKIKNVTGLIEALSTLNRAFTLIIVGDGPDRATIESTIAELGLEQQVRLVGQRAHKDALALIRACDVLILSSLMEQCPQVVLEGLALERPVIATTVGGTPEIKSERLYRVDTLAEIPVLLERENPLRVGEGAQIVEEYSLAKMVNRFEELYRSLVGT